MGKFSWEDRPETGDGGPSAESKEPVRGSSGRLGPLLSAVFTGRKFSASVPVSKGTPWRSKGGGLFGNNFEYRERSRLKIFLSYGT
jgi:hypothetical protein